MANTVYQPTQIKVKIKSDGGLQATTPITLKSTVPAVTNLNQLNDVSITSPAGNNDILTYSNTAGQWVNRAAPTLTGNGQQVVVTNTSPFDYQLSLPNNVTIANNIIVGSGFQVNGGITYVTEGVFGNVSITNVAAVANTLTVRDIVPYANNTYRIGTPGMRFTDLYLSGNTLTVGNVVFNDSNTALSIEDDVGNPISLLVGNTDVTGSLDVTQQFTANSLAANTITVYQTSNLVGSVVIGGQLTVGQSLAVNTTFNAGNTTITGFANVVGNVAITDTIAGNNMTLSGNLTVSGTTTYINTTNLNVGDNIVTLNADVTGATTPTENAGIEINRGNQANASLLWNESNDRWEQGNGYVAGSLTVTGPTSVANTLTVREIAITDGGLSNTASLVNNTSIASWNYNGRSFSVAGQETSGTGLSFKPDGTKMYIVGQTSDNVVEYNLSTAWDITSATFFQSFSILAQDTSSSDLAFSPDGTKMYVLGDTINGVLEYTLSTPWSVASATYIQQFSVATQETGPNGLFFKPDGTAFWVVGNGTDTVFEYTCSTPWNLSTASYSTRSFSVSTLEGTATGVFFTSDGVNMYVLGTTSDRIYHYTLATPWNVTTATLVGSVTVLMLNTTCNQIYYDTGVGRVWIIDSTSDVVFELTANLPALGINANVVAFSNTVRIGNTLHVAANSIVQGNFTAYGTSLLSGTVTTGGSVNVGGSGSLVVGNSTVNNTIIFTGNSVQNTSLSNTSLQVSLGIPGTITTATATTGGTLAAATYYYRITAIDANGNEGLGSTEVSRATTGSTSTITLTIPPVPGAYSYRVYRSTTTGVYTAGYIAVPITSLTVSGANYTYTDTGTALTVATLPTTTSARLLVANNTANGVGYFGPITIKAQSNVGILTMTPDAVFAVGGAGTANIAGNTTVSGILTARANAIVNGALTVANTVALGNTTVTGFINVSSTANVGGDITARANVTVNGAFVVANTAAVGNTTVGGFINVSSTANIGGVVTARSDVTVNGALTVANTAALGNTTITGFANVTTTLAAGNTTVTGFANISSTLAAGNTTVSGFANITSTLAAGNTTVIGFVNVSSTANVGGVANFRANVVANGQLIVANTISGGNTDLTGYINVSSTANVGGVANFRSNVIANGQLTVANTIAGGNTTITGFANVSSSLQVGGNVAITGQTAITNTFSAGNTSLANTDVTGYINVSSTANVGGIANFRSNVVANGTLTVANTIAGGNTDITGYINVSSTANVGGALTARGNATVNGAFVVANTAALGNTTITGFANVVGNLQVTNTLSGVDLTLSGNLTVSGTTTYINTTNLNIGDNIVVLNADVAGVTAPTENAGIEINRGSQANASFIWDESVDRWTTNTANIAVGAATTGNVDTTGYINVSSTANVGGVANFRSDVIANGQLTVTNTAALGNTSITGFANVSGNIFSGGQVSVGANVIANATALFVGNATVNSILTSSTLAVTGNGYFSSRIGIATQPLANTRIVVDGSGSSGLVVNKQSTYTITNANVVGAAAAKFIVSPYSSSTNGYISVSSIHSPASNGYTAVENRYYLSSNATGSYFGGIAMAYDTPNAGTDSANYKVVEWSGTTLQFFTAGGTRIHIGANGNVGIGNTTPTTLLAVSGTAALGNTDITGYINVSSTANVGGAINARSDLTVNGALTVANTAALGNTTVTGFANVTTNLQVGGNATIAGNVSITGQTSVTNTFSAGNTTLANTGISGFINVSSTANVGGVANFRSDVIANGTLTVANTIAGGNTTVTGFINVSSTANVGGDITARGNVTVNGALSVVNTAAFGNTTVTGFANITGNATVSGNAAITGNVAITGQTVVSNTFSAGNTSLTDTTITGFVNVSSTANVGGVANFRANVVANGQLIVANTISGGNTDLSGYINVSSTANIGGNINARSNVTVNGALVVVNTAALGNTTVTGFVDVSSYANIAGAANVGGNLTARGDVSVNGALTVVNTAAFGNTTITGWANVSGNVTAANLRTIGDLQIDGNFYVNGNTVTIGVSNFSVSDNMLYLNEPETATITNATSNGTAYIYTANNGFAAGMVVDVAGVSPSGYNISANTIVTANATHFTVANTSSPGAYVSGGTAYGKSAVNPDLGFAGGYNDGTYRHAGFFRDATDGVWKVFDQYVPEPNGAYIDTSNNTFRIADFQANNTTLGGLTVSLANTYLGGASGSESLRVVPQAGANRALEVKGGVAGSTGVRVGVTNEALDVYTSGGYSHYFATNGARSAVQFEVAHTASSVNYLRATGAATGGTVALTAQGSDANVSLNISAKGSAQLYLGAGASGGAVRISANGSEQLIVQGAASTVNKLNIKSGATGANPTIWATGTDANVGLDISSGTAGNIRLLTNDVNAGTGALQALVVHTASAVNYLQMSGGATGNGVELWAQGSDTNVNMLFKRKGSGNFQFYGPVYIGNNTNNYLLFQGASTGNSPSISGQGSDSNIDITLIPKGTGQTTVGTNFVNYIGLTGAATTKTVEARALGSDTNVAFTIDSKGTGAINFAAGSSGINFSNGGTVTAITRTASGSGYTSPPSVTIAPPTTAGGVQATANCTLGVSSATIGSGGSGYTLNDVITVSGGTFGAAAVCTVSGVSGGVVTAVTFTSFGSYTVLPTNPASTTGGTGTGLTLNLGGTFVNTTFNITNAGSGYVEQPAVTFSGGGGSGAAAYATVGSVSILRSLGVTGVAAFDFHGSASATNGVPILRLRDVNVATGNTSFVQIQNNNGYTQIVAQGAASAGLNIAANGNGRINFNTQGTQEITQFRVENTTSAVNFLQATGGTTGNRPSLTAAGTDTNIGIAWNTKGTGEHIFTSGAGTEAVVAASGSATDRWIILRGGSSSTGGTYIGSSTGALYVSSGTASNIRFFSDGLGVTEQFRVAHTASAVNYVQVTGAATGGGVNLSSQGSDTDVDFLYSAKGTGGRHVFRTNGTTRQFQINHTTSAVNYPYMTGSIAGAAVPFSVAGSDTNIDLALTPKGTGVTASTGPVQIETDTVITTKTLTTTATTADQTIASFSGSTYRSAEFVIQAVDATGTKYQKTKILAIHNGTTAEYTEFGNVNIGGDCGTFNVLYSTGNLILAVTPASTNSTVFKVTCILSKV